MSQSFVQSSFTREDLTFEVPIRPQSLSDFIGQDHVKERLEVVIGAAKQRGDSLGHCLFSGPPGLGKTTLASILSKAMGTNLVTTSGPVIDKPGDLAGILTGLKTGDVLFIDEIHRLNRSVEEYLYQAMEDFALDLMIDSGPNARTVQVKLNKFTLAGATTRLGLLSEPFRSRFALTCRLDYYDPALLQRVVDRTSRILNISIDEASSFEIARRARGTPRIANNLLRWVRDYSQMRADNKMSRQVVHEALNLLSIDEKGLDEMDIKMLRVIRDHYEGGPVGLNTIAVSIGEEPSTIEEVLEPFLIMQGLLKRTPQGRMLTDQAYQHMERSLKGA